MAERRDLTRTFVFLPNDTSLFKTKIIIPNYLTNASPLLKPTASHYKCGREVKLPNEYAYISIDTIVYILQRFTREVVKKKVLAIPNVKSAPEIYKLGRYLFPEIRLFSEMHVYKYIALCTTINGDLASITEDEGRTVLQPHMQLHKYLESLSREQLIEKLLRLGAIDIGIDCTIFEGETLAEKLSRWYDRKFPPWFTELLSDQTTVPLNAFLIKHKPVVLQFMYEASLCYLLYEAISYEEKFRYIVGFTPPSIDLRHICNNPITFEDYQVKAECRSIYIAVENGDQKHYIFTLAGA